MTAKNSMQRTAPHAAILWRRLDTPGHDACRLVRQASGWRLEGTALFRHGSGDVARLSYVVECDDEWRTRCGEVRGWVGGYELNMRLARTLGGQWKLNDQVVAGLDECIDLDLGFTPATNIFQMRRIALEVGQAEDVSAAWLDVPEGCLTVLRQRYERRSAEEYWYEAAQFEYAALLLVSPAGFVTDYPGLWEAVSTAPGKPVETAAEGGAPEH